MELAKITEKGQITIPKSIRDKLGLKAGSKVLFLEKDGKIHLANSSIEGLHKVQAAFAGEAERLGRNNDEDIMDMIREVRSEKQ